MTGADLPVMRRIATRIALIEGRCVADVLAGMVDRATRADGSRPLVGRPCKSRPTAVVRLRRRCAGRAKVEAP